MIMRKLVALALLLPTLCWAQVPGFTLQQFGTVGVGNDTPAFQGALDACRANGVNGCRIWLESRTYIVDSLNATGINGLEITGTPNTFITSPIMSAPSAMLDLTNSDNVKIVSVSFILNTQTMGANVPRAAILISGKDRYLLDNITVNGPFTSACIAIISADSVTIRDSQLMSHHPSAPCVLISNTSDWGISSRFAEIPQHAAANDVIFQGGEIHGLGRQQWTTYIRNATHIVFNGTLHDNSGSAHMLLQGTVSFLTSTGQKFYSELGTPSGSIYECSGTCDHVRMRNAMYWGIPATTVGATFSSYLND